MGKDKDLKKREERLKLKAESSKENLDKEDVPQKKVTLTAASRFNNHDPGDVFNANEADAEKWIRSGFAKKATKEDIEAWEARKNAGEQEPEGEGPQEESGSPSTSSG